MEWEKLLKWMSLKLAAESTTEEDARVATDFLEIQGRSTRYKSSYSELLFFYARTQNPRAKVTHVNYACEVVPKLESSHLLYS